MLYLKADISAVSDESQIVRSGAEARGFYCKPGFGFIRHGLRTVKQLRGAERGS